MGNKSERKRSKPAPLRKRAEALLLAGSDAIKRIPPEDIKTLFHELQVHQMELEVQNEELRMAQVELAQSRDRFNELYDFAPIGYLTLDTKSTILEANLTLAGMLDVARSDLVHRKFRRFVARESQDAFYVHLQQVFSSDRSVSCVISLRRPDGETMAIQLESIAIEQPIGQTRQCLVALIDVSSRKRAERELEESEEQYRLLFSMNPNPMYVFEARTLRILAVNEAMVSLYQWSREEFLRMTAAEIRPPEEVPKLIAAVKKQGSTRAAYTGLWRHKKKNGSPLEVEVTVSALEYEGHNSRLAMVRDVTESLKAEKELQQTKERLRLALEGAQMGSWEWDFESNQAYWDTQLFDLLGIPKQPNPVDAKLLFDRVDPQDLPVLRARIDQAIEANTDFYHEFRIVRPDGKVRWLAGVGRPQRNPHGGSNQIFGVNFDITSRKELETALKDLNLRLEQRVLERSAIAEARASQIQVLAGELSKAEQRERDRLAQMLHDHLQQLLVAAKMRMMALVKSNSASKRVELEDGIFDLLAQSIEATRSLSLELSPPVLREKGFAAALEWLARQMEMTHQLQVELACDAAAEPQDETTLLLCYQAARELLFNVRKHANVDRARLETRAGDDGQINLIVSDQGAGFNLLQYRTNLESPQSFGLANIRQRLQIVGGDLAIETAEGSGTTVRLWIPKRFPVSRHTLDGFAGPVAAIPPSPPRLKKKSARRISRKRQIRVLLADDHRLMRESLGEVLASHGEFEIVGEAGDGYSAIELARQLEPDVVLMDVGMPHFDGIQATRHICREVPRTCVIGLSMHEEISKSRPMLDAGAVAYLSKTGPLQDLIDTIHHFVKPRRVPVRKARNPQAPKPE